jgi:hypothetical protein
MTDEMDVYLSRSLKNWAAARQPVIQKESLLKLAASAPRYTEPLYFHTRPVVNEFSGNRLMGYCTGSWLQGSMTFSMAWPANLDSLVRVAL